MISEHNRYYISQASDLDIYCRSEGLQPEYILSSFKKNVAKPPPKKLMVKLKKLFIKQTKVIKPQRSMNRIQE